MVIAESLLAKIAKTAKVPKLGVLPKLANAPLDILELRHRRRESALTHLVTAAYRLGVVREADVLLASLLRCEKVIGSGLGRGVAVPHARSLTVARPFLMVGRAPRGLDWAAFDGAPVHLVVLVLSPAETSADRHLGRVAEAAHAARTQRTRARLMAADAETARALLEGAGT